VPKQKDPLLTYKKVAEVAHVELGTVYMWKKRGILPSPAPETVGRRPVWRLSTILEWLEATGRADIDIEEYTDINHPEPANGGS
jgi:predicted DNA-binding transcriptional regulator AlpA